MKTFRIAHRLGPEVHTEKKSYLFFSGTSYLGIDYDRQYEAVLMDCIRQYGFNHGLSRVNNLQLKIFDEFENFFAKKAKAEAAAVMSSGFLAGISAWQWLYPQAELCWIAPDTHPAILPSSLKPDFQLSFTQWKNQCIAQAELLSSRKILILGNAVDPLRAEIHHYDWIKEIAQKHEVTLLIDDSHAFGVLGNGIFGTYAQWKDSKINLVVSGSLGKGLGMPAGIILGNTQVIEGIKSQAIFTGSSPCAPANLQAFLKTQDIYKAQHQKIRDLSGIFNQETEELSAISGSRNFPVFILNEDSFPEKLEKNNFVISSFAYPHPNSPKINRIVLSGYHTLGDLMALLEILHHLSEK
ncbi:MAG: aminotransferase class I/II-fold pyridoxal phosphate-dependent enzyme [Cyclobacteriaceae bacterium]|nr:aminotransferase class I/II-fold pyridoxal phosphate-dependent enzyme [Cyclobacteriaceae bacterium]